ncbi:Phage tail sheath protein [Janthinobacterium sp. KBS0711]|uniref:phage tail sheath family protein n=1 Tax=Janthinobacterium sp. KBS0711 TaxID=1649647 RepID=UPI000627C568|nr:phage tail sheath C-terminal domain-containing protein [Janthinobacterium sp. KBS0711]KKO61899.1 Phage tail sheath protein [Janthinobacterium sp. KBS0711]TSD71918.1 phage tail sheath family protein [Janthinobacterium sp. KBS0711]
MAQYKTPGVSIVEKNAFPDSVVEVATAVPAFVGYTASASHDGESLRNQPWRIASMAEFTACFGGAPMPGFMLEAGHAPGTPGGASCTLRQVAGHFLLYHSMQLFFQNGGGACHIVSVGDYHDTPDIGALRAGIDALLQEREVTLLAVPDAMLLALDDCHALQRHMLMHCGQQMRNRFAILDIHNGAAPLTDGPVAAFREGIGSDSLAYGAAYYPWVQATVVPLDELNFTHIRTSHWGALQDLLLQALDAGGQRQVSALFEQMAIAHSSESAQASRIAAIDHALRAMSPLYQQLLLAMHGQLNLLPPGAAMAGLYTLTDNTRGVWKAPANVGIAAVSAPAVNITQDEQEGLNVHGTGKSVNAIRSFAGQGQGTLVWGAHTLDGNSLDWRYINIRRTMIMLEQSLRLAIQAYVFEPNVASTWVTIGSMASNFLTGIWKRGGLAGASPSDAFQVEVGLGTTMTADDLLEGILRVNILVAISRPAEFIELTFQQQMQKS